MKPSEEARKAVALAELIDRCEKRDGFYSGYTEVMQSLAAYRAAKAGGGA